MLQTTAPSSRLPALRLRFRAPSFGSAGAPFPTKLSVVDGLPFWMTVLRRGPSIFWSVLISPGIVCRTRPSSLSTQARRNSARRGAS